MTYIHVAPRAAATVNAGTTYMMNRHSLCERKLINVTKTKEGKRKVRMRWSTTKPTIERGKEDINIFGRCVVKYASGGEVCMRRKIKDIVVLKERNVHPIQPIYLGKR